IVLQHPWIVLFDFFSGNFESRCNDVKIVAGPYVPCLTLSSRPHRASKKGIENERKKKSSFHISSLLRIRLLLDSKRLAGRWGLRYGVTFGTENIFSQKAPLRHSRLPDDRSTESRSTILTLDSLQPSDDLVSTLQPLRERCVINEQLSLTPLTASSAR